MSRAAGWLALALLALGCARGPQPPAALDASGREPCRSCRMAISDVRTAGQIVAPLEDPMFFDDLGCLADYLKRIDQRDLGATTYVADHRTGAWIRAAAAVYTKSPTQTPMGSGLMAHATAASRDADPASQGGAAVTAQELFGPGGPPDGAR